ncbi:MAG TPA: DUF1648 domain-containing protein [Saprospiraceae bacterium]|nr:DUF1648 domain-containing protein [Saprospiraceae bacterium]
MSQRPRLQIPLTAPDRIIEAAGWVCLAALWAMTLYAYGNLPETIPTHFGVGGEVDDYGSKMTLFFLPVIGTILFIGLTVLNNYPHIFNYPADITPENALSQYTNATRMIRMIKFSITFISLVIVYMIYNAVITGSGRLGSAFVPILVVVLVIPLAYFTIRAIRGK